MITDIAGARAAAFSSDPGRLRRVAAFAAMAGRNGEPFTEVETVMDGDASWWDRAPGAARRASVVLDEACRGAYRVGQKERARAAMVAHFEASDEPRAERLISVAARATHCSDGDNSTLIDGEDLVELVVEILGEEAMDDAHANIHDIASEALGTYHLQIVVNQDHADALRAGERYAERIVDVGHALPTSERLAELIVAEDDLVDMEDARDIAQRAIAREQRERDMEAMKAADALRAASLWEARESIETLYEVHGTRRAPAPVAMHVGTPPQHTPHQAVSTSYHGASNIDLNASWSPEPTIDLKDPAVWRDPPRDIFPAALIDEEEEEPIAVPKAVGHLNELTSPRGLVGDIMDWMEASSDRPNRSLLLGAALTLVGTLAGRNYASDTNLRTNNYIVTLAP
jgi:hypothetical protein